MKKTILFCLSLLLPTACKDSDVVVCPDATDANVLMLVVDYSSPKFEGATLFCIANAPRAFTIRHEYVAPGDFGWVKLFYDEGDKMLFHGEIIWMGNGKMLFPEKLYPAEDFNRVLTQDFVSPKNGFVNVFNPDNRTDDVSDAWGAVQGLVIVRDFLKENPGQKINHFLYTPGVGVGDPKQWKWVFFMKR